MKDEKSEKKISICTLVNILAAIIFFVLQILSATLFRSQFVNGLICRVLARGVFGLLLLYNGAYLLFTERTGFIWYSVKPRQRLLGGVALGIAGLYLLITALMGHGVNGDPTLIWWRTV